MMSMESNRRQIGLFGGSFNPITRAHIEVAQSVIQKTYVDEVWISPCFGHTIKSGLEDSAYRLAMCKIATEGLEHIKVFDYEIKNKLNSGTYDFVQRLLADKELTEKQEFSYIIGMDNVDIFDSWKNAEELKKIIKFIVFPRPGSKPPPPNSWCNTFPNLCIDSAGFKISSSHVRFLLKMWWADIPVAKRILERCLIKDVEPNVLKYIWSNGLYK